MNRAALVIFVGVALAGCSGGFRPQDYPGPQALLDVSEDMFRRGDCGDAALGFRRLTLTLPIRDSLAIRSRFLLAECHFVQGEYLEAARQFRRVIDDAPSSGLAPNALLRSGDAQTELWNRPELDPTYGEAAGATYRELLSRFPNTQAAATARIRLSELSERFAVKDFKNGDYYRRLGAFDSAILYFRNVIAQYGETSVASNAVVRLIEIYEELEYSEEMREMCQHLQQFYPNEQDAEEECRTVTASQ
jgi:outer membrane protein assembly factor BamD